MINNKSDRIPDDYALGVALVFYFAWQACDRFAKKHWPLEEEHSGEEADTAGEQGPEAKPPDADTPCKKVINQLI